MKDSDVPVQFIKLKMNTSQCAPKLSSPWSSCPRKSDLTEKAQQSCHRRGDLDRERPTDREGCGCSSPSSPSSPWKSLSGRVGEQGTSLGKECMNSAFPTKSVSSSKNVSGMVSEQGTSLGKAAEAEAEAEASAEVEASTKPIHTPSQYACLRRCSQIRSRGSTYGRARPACTVCAQPRP